MRFSLNVPWPYGTRISVEAVCQLCLPFLMSNTEYFSGILFLAYCLAGCAYSDIPTMLFENYSNLFVWSWKYTWVKHGNWHVLYQPANNLWLILYINLFDRIFSKNDILHLWDCYFWKLGTSKITQNISECTVDKAQTCMVYKYCLVFHSYLQLNMFAKYLAIFNVNKNINPKWSELYRQNV